ncbi:MAG: hypothetical protein ABSG52_14440 [Terriglobales bacterium]|jgi:hypothetical protein
MARKSKGKLASEAAALLAKLRAASMTAAQRTESARKAGKARMAKLTQEERRAIQSKGGKATAAKRKRRFQ